MALDNFTDNNDVALESHDANWAGIGASYPVTNLEIYNNQVQHEGAWQSSGARYSASSQDSSQIVFKAGTNGTALRHACVRASASSRGYAINLSAISGGNYTSVDISKNGEWLGSLSVASSYSVTSDHTVRITASGTSTVTIRGYVDGVEVGSGITDSSSPIESGNPGFWTGELGAVAEGYYDDWTDGASGASSTPSSTPFLKPFSQSLGRGGF